MTAKPAVQSIIRELEAGHWDGVAYCATQGSHIITGLGGDVSAIRNMHGARMYQYCHAVTMESPAKIAAELRRLADEIEGGA